MEAKKVSILYAPVVHQGYLAYLKTLEAEGVETLYLISDDILASHEEFDYLNRKDRLRALPHETMKRLLSSCTTLPLESLTLPSILALQAERVVIYAPEEDITTTLLEVYFTGHKVRRDSVFLRWNRENLGEEKEPKTGHIALSDFEKEVFAQVLSEAEKSADWWRQVGAALVKDGEVISVAHNEHMPEPELPNILGDARALFKKGVNINYSTAAHAEASVIGEAAKKGVSTEGAELFVTDFPCPYCARLIAKSGIKKVYYLKGYAVLGGDEFLKEVGGETVKIDLEA